MSESLSTHFQELNQNEKLSKLTQVVNSKSELTIWEKGDKERETFSCVDFNRERVEVILYKNGKSQKNKKEILYSFKLNGLSFFGKGKLNHLNADQYVLSATEILFKGERRTTFRLLTHPHHQVYIGIPIPEEQVEKSNVLSIQSKMSQTNLFKNFLSLISEDKDGEYRDGYFPFRVLDISVTGLAFQIGDLEAELFPQDKVLEKIFLDFNGEEIAIPKANVVYNVSIIQSNSKQKNNKIGLSFMDVDTNLDLKLGSLINGALRDVESEFEDFI